MSVTFYCGSDDLGRSFSPALGGFYLPRLDKGQKTGNRLFHCAGRFDYLGKEHLFRSKQVANHVHAINDLDRLARLNAIFFDSVGNPFTRAWVHLSRHSIDYLYFLTPSRRPHLQSLRAVRLNRSGD